MLHFVVMAVAGATGGAPLRWLLGWALPCTLGPLVLALVGHLLSNEQLVRGFLVTIVWMALYALIGGHDRTSDRHAVRSTVPADQPTILTSEE